jgi:hypothetical protein
VLLQITDFNLADAVIDRSFAAQWRDLADVMQSMPLHLKASDQAGIQGTPIFDPVGTNEYIKAELGKRGWDSGIPIPTEYNFLGTGVDFGRQGLLVEVQFSNYPFLLNNTIRSELFYKAALCAKISETPSRPAFSVGGGEGNTHEDEGKWCCIAPLRFGLAWRGAE